MIRVVEGEEKVIDRAKGRGRERERGKRIYYCTIQSYLRRSE